MSSRKSIRGSRAPPLQQGDWGPNIALAIIGIDQLDALNISPEEAVEAIARNFFPIIRAHIALAVSHKEGNFEQALAERLVEGEGKLKTHELLEKMSDASRKIEELTEIVTAQSSKMQALEQNLEEANDYLSQVEGIRDEAARVVERSRAFAQKFEERYPKEGTELVEKMKSDLKEELALDAQNSSRPETEDKEVQTTDDEAPPPPPDPDSSAPPDTAGKEEMGPDDRRLLQLCIEEIRNLKATLQNDIVAFQGERNGESQPSHAATHVRANNAMRDSGVGTAEGCDGIELTHVKHVPLSTLRLSPICRISHEPHDVLAYAEGNTMHARPSSRAPTPNGEVFDQRLSASPQSITNEPAVGAAYSETTSMMDGVDYDGQQDQREQEARVNMQYVATESPQELDTSKLAPSNSDSHSLLKEQSNESSVHVQQVHDRVVQRDTSSDFVEAEEKSFQPESGVVVGSALHENKGVDNVPAAPQTTASHTDTKCIPLNEGKCPSGSLTSLPENARQRGSVAPLADAGQASVVQSNNGEELNLVETCAETEKNQHNNDGNVAGVGVLAERTPIVTDAEGTEANSASSCKPVTADEPRPHKSKTAFADPVNDITTSQTSDGQDALNSTPALTGETSKNPHQEDQSEIVGAHTEYPASSTTNNTRSSPVSAEEVFRWNGPSVWPVITGGPEWCKTRQARSIPLAPVQCQNNDASAPAFATSHEVKSCALEPTVTVRCQRFGDKVPDASNKPMADISQMVYIPLTGSKVGQGGKAAKTRGPAADSRSNLNSLRIRNQVLESQVLGLSVALTQAHRRLNALTHVCELLASRVDDAK